MQWVLERLNVPLEQSKLATILQRMSRESATESLVLALKQRIVADPPFNRWAGELRGFFWKRATSKTRPRLNVNESTSVDAALDEVIARFPETLDYLAK
jgi:hypothetical protein